MEIELRWDVLSVVVGFSLGLERLGVCWVLLSAFRISLGVQFDAGVDLVETFLDLRWDWWRCWDVVAGGAESPLVGGVLDVDDLAVWCLVRVLALLH